MPPSGAIDGIVGGVVAAGSGVDVQEWASKTAVGSWIQLTWSTPQQFNQIALYGSFTIPLPLPLLSLFSHVLHLR
jgi:hypothetical protein